jgi:hypothetical protein
MKQSRFKYSGTSLAHFDRQGAPKGEARFSDLTARKKRERKRDETECNGLAPATVNTHTSP